MFVLLGVGAAHAHRGVDVAHAHHMKDATNLPGAQLRFATKLSRASPMSFVGLFCGEHM